MAETPIYELRAKLPISRRIQQPRDPSTPIEHFYRSKSRSQQRFWAFLFTHEQPQVYYYISDPILLSSSFVHSYSFKTTSIFYNLDMLC